MTSIAIPFSSPMRLCVAASMLSLIGAASVATSPSTSHLKIMGFYGFDPDAQHGWTNLGMEGAASLKVYAMNTYGLPSLYGDLENVFDREHKGLMPNWEATLTKIVHEEYMPLAANGTYKGVFLGDEICCGGVPLDDLATVLKSLRSLVGPEAILYTNECAEMSTWPSVPTELDYISMDTYGGFEPPGNATQSALQVQEFYTEHVFPKLADHQAALLVPGTFACSNTTYFPLDQQDALVAKSLELLYEWAKTEPKIAGFNPWHFHNRSGAQHPPPCDMELGLEALPNALKTMQTIGKEIVVNNARL